MTAPNPMLDIAAYDLATARARRLVHDGLTGRAGPQTPTSHPRLLLEYCKSNIMHLCGLDPAAADRQAAALAEELVVTTSVDHAPEFAAGLVRRLDCLDAADVLGQARHGRGHVFFGFHTGPYWSMGFHLVAIGLEVAVLVPPHLSAQTRSIAAIASACAGDGPGRMHFVPIAGSGFLQAVQEHLRAGRQVLSFIDGTGGDRAGLPSRRDVTIPFMNGELRLKTTMSRLAALHAVPLVVYHGDRGPTGRRIVLEPPFPPREEADHRAFLQRSFDGLADRLGQDPSQWEAWSYIHQHYSPAFRALLAERASDADTLESRCFLIRNQCGELVAIDRLTFRGFVVPEKRGVVVPEERGLVVPEERGLVVPEDRRLDVGVAA